MALACAGREGAGPRPIGSFACQALCGLLGDRHPQLGHSAMVATHRSPACRHRPSDRMVADMKCPKLHDRKDPAPGPPRPGRGAIVHTRSSPHRQAAALQTPIAVGRYYDSQTGQFLSVDPLVDETEQPYEYADDEPTKNTDPYGQSSSGCIGTDSGDGFELCFGIVGSGQTVDQMSVYVIDRDQVYKGSTTFNAALAITGPNNNRIIIEDGEPLTSIYWSFTPWTWAEYIVDWVPPTPKKTGQYCGIWIGAPPNNTRIGNQGNGACEGVE